MKLENALELQKTLRRTLPGRISVRGGWPSIALGIAPAGRRGDYRIAVRSKGPLTDDVLSVVERKARGEIDWRIVGTIVASRRRLALGVSTAHQRGCTGTIGFFARDERGALGFVSNNHVIAAEDRGAEGDEIIQPGQADGGSWPGDVIGRLAGDYPRLRPGDQTVDCAFARLVTDVDVETSLGEGKSLSPTPVPPEGEEAVFKIGRTTARTEGRITAFHIDDLEVGYSTNPPIRFHGQIEIESTDSKPFSRPGDSGALIFNPDGHPLALLFACSEEGGKSGAGLTYANPIGEVLRQLRVALIS